MVVILISVCTFSNIIRKYDRFNDETVLQSSFRKIVDNGRPDFEFIAHYTGKTFSGNPSSIVLSIMIVSSSTEWQYLDCYDTSWLIDGNHITLPKPDHDGSIGDGYVLEYITIGPIKFEDFRRLANSKKIEAKICNDEFVLTADEKEDIDQIYSFFSGKVTNSEQKSTVPSGGEVLTDEKVIALVQAGLGDEIIIKKIQSTQCNYDLSTPSLIELKKNGISTDILSAMLKRQNDKDTNINSGQTSFPENTEVQKENMQKHLEVTKSNKKGWMNYSIGQELHISLPETWLVFHLKKSSSESQIESVRKRYPLINPVFLTNIKTLADNDCTFFAFDPTSDLKEKGYYSNVSVKTVQLAQKLNLKTFATQVKIALEKYHPEIISQVKEESIKVEGNEMELLSYASKLVKKSGGTITVSTYQYIEISNLDCRVFTFGMLADMEKSKAPICRDIIMSLEKNP